MSGIISTILILVLIILVFVVFLGEMSYKIKEKNKEKKNKEEANKDTLIDDYDYLMESFNESISKYQKIINKQFAEKEKVYKDKHDSEKDELEYVEEEVKKLKKFAEEIKLLEKIYKINDYIKYQKSSTINLFDNSVLEIKKVDSYKGFHLIFNNKTFKLIEVSFSGTYPDGENYITSRFSLYDFNNNLVFEFHTSDDLKKEWFNDDRVNMGQIITFKNYGWVLDISLLYENIIKKEEANMLSSKYSTTNLERLQKNFNIYKIK